MKNLFVTIALMGFLSYATAQQTPKSNKKSKAKTDTITNRTTKSEKKSTYRVDSTKSRSAQSKTSKGRAKTQRDSVPRYPSRPKDSVR